MIAKVIGRRRDGSSSFAALAAYIADTRKASYVVLNGVHSLRTAAAEMRFVSDSCPRCRKALYHVVISWPEGEAPSNQQAEAAARHLLERIGFLDHQWILAVHRDTGNVHVHIMVCRIHPETGRAHSPYRDWRKLDKACREVEIAQGWSHDRGRWAVARNGKDIVWAERQPRSAPALSDGARRLERKTGGLSFQSWVAAQPADIVRAAKSWAEIHARFADLGIVIQAKGSGYIIVDHTNPTAVAKLSHMGLGGMQKIVTLLGDKPYQPPPEISPVQRIVDAPPVDTRVHAPFEDGSRRERTAPRRDPDMRRQRRLARVDARDELHDRFRQLAEEEAAQRDTWWAGWKQRRKDEQKERDALRAMQKQRRTELGAYRMSVIARRALTSVAAMQAAREREDLEMRFQRERAALRAQLAALARTTWDGFLRARAAAGDRAAEAALRGMRYRNRGTTTPEPPLSIKPVRQPAAEDRPRPRPLGDLRWEEREDGVAYLWDERVVFVDHGPRIAVHDESADAIRAALLLAQERWPDGFILTGTQEFREHAAAVAVAEGIGHLIIDPDLAELIARLEAAKPVQVQDEPWPETPPDTPDAEPRSRAGGSPPLGSEFAPEPPTPDDDPRCGVGGTRSAPSTKVEDTAPAEPPHRSAATPIIPTGSAARSTADDAPVPRNPLCGARIADSVRGLSRELDAATWRERLTAPGTWGHRPVTQRLCGLADVPNRDAVELRLPSADRLHASRDEVAILPTGHTLDQETLNTFIAVLRCSGWQGVTLSGDPEWCRHLAIALAREPILVSNADLKDLVNEHRRRYAMEALDGSTGAVSTKPPVASPSRFGLTDAERQADREAFAALEAEHDASFPWADASEPGPPATPSPQPDIGAAWRSSSGSGDTARCASAAKSPASADPPGEPASAVRNASPPASPPSPASVADRWNRLAPGASGLGEDWHFSPALLRRYGEALRTDDAGNNCIAHRAANGAVLGHTIVTPRSLEHEWGEMAVTPGGRRGVAMLGDRAAYERVVVTSTALDALAAAALDGEDRRGRTLYVGLGLEAEQPAYDELRTLLERRPARELVFAVNTDRDARGQSMRLFELSKVLRTRVAGMEPPVWSSPPDGHASWIGRRMAGPPDRTPVDLGTRDEHRTPGRHERSDRPQGRGPHERDRTHGE